MRISKVLTARRPILFLLLCLLPLTQLHAQRRNSGSRQKRTTAAATAAKTDNAAEKTLQPQAKVAPKTVAQQQSLPADTVPAPPITPQTIVDESPFLLKGLGAQLWKNFIDNGAEAEVAIQMGKIAQLQPDGGRLASLQSAYGKDAGDMDNVKKQLLSRMNTFLDSMSNVPLNKIANGALMLSTTDYSDSVAAIDLIEKLTDVLNKQAADTAVALRGEKRLLTIVKANRAIAPILNNHPAAVKVAKNTQPMELAQSPAHLLYWGHTATAPFDGMEPQPQIPDPGSFIFIKEQENSDVNVMAEGISLAHIRGNVIDCHNTDLMNLNPMPNSVYNYSNICFYTDALGRVVKVTQSFADDQKGKSKDHNGLKPKQMVLIKGSDQATEPYLLAQKTHHGPESLLNTVFIEKSDANKVAVNLLKNLIKEYRDFADSNLTTTVTYAGFSQVPSEITIKVGPHKQPVVLKNKVTKLPKPTSETD